MLVVSWFIVAYIMGFMVDIVSPQINHQPGLEIAHLRLPCVGEPSLDEMERLASPGEATYGGIPICSYPSLTNNNNS